MPLSVRFWLLLASFVAAPLSAFAGTAVDIRIAVGSPPPAIVLRQEPRLLVVPGSTVCVVREDCGYDLFHYGVYWYAFNEGAWYRARRHRGPFKLVQSREVPSAIVNVPARYWRHAPAKPSKVKRADVVAANTGRERGRGRGR